MADNKATPRQKMIGLMYLVLTALLALQVDNVVLDKFLLIDESLKESVHNSRNESQKVFKGIEEAVRKRSNNAAANEILQKAKIIVQETNATVSEIENLRDELIDVSGGMKENGMYAGAEEINKVMALTLGPSDSKTGEGYHLKKTLNDYAQKISSLDPDITIPALALDASQMDLYKNTEQKNKDFVELTFDNTPMVAALAVLSQIQTEVAKTESKALRVLADKVGAEEYRVDRVEAMVSPESKVVTAGTPYRAKLFIAASSSSSSPVMTSSAGDVDVSDSGIGSLEFIASADKFDASGRAKKIWTGSITLKTPSGDSTFNISEEYEVARPTLQFRSKAIQALYYNCGNNIEVSVPELGNYFDPLITAQGAYVENGADKKNVIIIPTEKKVEITVKSKGIYIGTEEFRVKPIPRPSIQVFSESGLLDLKKGGRFPRQIRIKAIPDEDFAEFLPRDARYKVTRFEISLIRNGIPREVRTVSDDQFDLSSMARIAQKGDRIVIDVKEVKRKNYRDNVENVNVGIQVFPYEITK